MRPRGSYDVNNVEKGKAEGRDHSYRSCIQALIIFFLLCIILILTSYLLKKENIAQVPQTHDVSTKVKLYGNKFTSTTAKPLTLITENAGSNTTVTNISVRDSPPTTNTITAETNETKIISLLTATGVESQTITSTEPIEVVTDIIGTVKNDEQSFTTFHKRLTTKILETTSENYEMITQMNTSKEYAVNATIAEIRDIEDEKISTFSNYADTTEAQFRGRSIFETATIEGISKEVTTLHFDQTPSTVNEMIEMINETSQLWNETMLIDEMILNISTTTPLSSSAETSVKHNTTIDLFTTQTIEYMDMNTVSNYPTKITSPTESPIEMNNTKESMDDKFLTDSTTMSSDIVEEQTIKTLAKKSTLPQTCTSALCKHTASKMLLYMNHSADPCDDFYEYACGGLEEDSQILERDLNDKAYQRILRQIRKSRDKNTVFALYYNSCINYDTVVSMSQRTKLAKEELGKIGTFYTEANHPHNLTDFTKLFADLILNNGALLFDIVPDLEDVYNPKQYTLRIGPSMRERLFDDEDTDDYCYNIEESDVQNKHIDLGELYTKYSHCKSDTKQFLRFIPEALRTFGVFQEHNSSQYIHQTLRNIDFEIMKGYFSNYPAADKIHQAYLAKNYTQVTLRELSATCTLINWAKLIHSLTGLYIEPTATLYVYFYEQVFSGLKKLEDFVSRNGGWQLNNALLGLYARDLYNQLVAPRHKHTVTSCLRIATNILPASASSLYMSSFSNQELIRMNGKIHDLFNELKKTLKLNVEKIEWADFEGRQELLKKINDIKLFVPDIEYFSHEHLKYEKTATHGLQLSDNYFLNSLTLLQKYRSLKYEGVKTEEVGSQQIWTYYATPFQSKGVSLYGLNCVIVPFGAVDWSIFPEKTESSFDYLAIATLGNLIAYQIAHHFDANGINYWNGIMNTNVSVLFGSEFTNMNFEDYITCQKYYAYQEALTLRLPFTDQTVSFQISQLTLNARLSQVMGLRLAYDTLIRLKAEETAALLPWLEFNIKQIFYLAYAQMYCTKTPLTSSYVSVYENEQLPSRIRIFVSISNNKPFSDVWGCQIGSRNFPNESCGVFPYLQLRETVITME